ncbi:MAG: thioredoxin domain-containing protein, partial [Acidobacteriota bacterium]
MRGNPDAPVTIIEFSDFQCPYCTRGAQTVEQILEKYPNDVKFVFKHFPLGFHPWAKPAAVAANCAANQNQDAFWTLHDKYFEHQKELNVENVMAKSKEFLGGSGLDMATWSACAENQESAEYKAAAALVDSDMNLGKSLGVTGTPGFFVNGTFLNGAQPLAAFEPLIQQAKSNS